MSSKARVLREEIKKLNAREVKSTQHDEEIDKLEQEKEALLRLVADINNRSTLELLTEEGLLPNYAFPESPVSLRSVIWRKRKQAVQGKSKYETQAFEYKRSPSSALELAPFADFYAGGRSQIAQVDVSLSKPENWRFCTECQFCMCVDGGDEARGCPACGAESWVDDGQRFRLLKLQQVFARTSDKDSVFKTTKTTVSHLFFSAK